MNGSTQYPARFFYANYETFDCVFHSAYLVGIRTPLAMRRYVWPLLIKHGVLFFLVGCERGQRSRFLAKKRVEALCLPFLPRAGSIQILPPGKPGTPPCKSGQLEKDLGLEVSSARHAARLIIFEIIRSFFSLVQVLQSRMEPESSSRGAR